MDYLQFVIKMLIGLVIVMSMFRIFGKKELAQMRLIDLIFVIAVSDFFTNSVVDTEIDWKKLVFLLVVWGIILYGLEMITLNKTAQQFLEGKPRPLILNGKINEDLREKEKMSDNEIYAMLRKQGVFDINLVEVAVLEVDGHLSVKTKG